jgi:membrane-bound lytic murein transglycosylase D
LIVAATLLAGCTGLRRTPDPAPAPTDDRAALETVPADSPPPEVPESTAAPFIQSLDLEPVTADGEAEATEELTPAPVDELAEELPEVPPDRAEEERELATQAPPTYDVPMVVNDQVLRWLDYYAVRRNTSFVQGLERSGRYVERFREIFAEHGVPQDLVYLAHVESAYKTSAYSRAHAKGIYQFISGTARRYGLRVDWYVDERSDQEKSARASASYLRDLYDEFGDWYLALAGYNAGEGRVRRAIARSGSKDFWVHSEKRLYRRETRNYVPAILAAILISKEPEKYGFTFTPESPLVYETIQVEGAADLRVLAECAGTTVDVLRDLNPALRRMQTPPDATTDVRVPPGTGGATLARLSEVPVRDRVLFTLHRIRRGDTLGAIARRYGVSVHSIQIANGMGRSTMIREGRTLKVPTSSAPASTWAASTVDRRAIAAGDPVVVRVRRGDTLWGIARRYGTTPDAIAAANDRSVRAVLHPGDRLTVHPGGGAVSGVTPVTGETVEYRVRRGDTLSGIASRYGTSARAIAAASGISLRSVLHPGDRLQVPGTPVRAAAGSTTVDYTVRRGDSLWRIANRHRTTVAAICRANGIRESDTLRPGTRLSIPMP